MTVIMTYEGYALYARESGGYVSDIDGEIIRFGTASQWIEYIKKVLKK